MASAATLNHPGGICFDKSGNLYIGDDGNYRVRKVNTSGFITNYAGNGLLGWGGDGGLAINAKCNPYSGICIDTNGNLYIAEWGSGTVRKIDPAGIITTIAGDTSSHTYNGDGIPATSAHLDPDFILIADSGAVIISDAVNNRLRKIDVAGIIHTLAGIGVAGYSGDNGPSDSAKINYPTGLAFDHCGHLFFGQNTPPRIRKITFPGTLPSISITSHTSASPGDTVSVTAVVTHSCCPGFSISWMNHGVVFATTTSTSVNYVKNTGTDSITAKLIGCGDTAVSGLQVVTNAKVGISDPNPTNAKMRLYPNPVHTQLIITSTGIIGSVTISNFLGQVFFSKEYNADTAEMNIQSLPVGVYLVKITGSDGSVLTKKLLKE